MLKHGHDINRRPIWDHMMLTRLCILDPLELYFHIVHWGLQGYYSHLIFLFLNIDSGDSLKPTIFILSTNKKTITNSKAVRPQYLSSLCLRYFITKVTVVFVAGYGSDKVHTRLRESFITGHNCNRKTFRSTEKDDIIRRY